MNRDDLWKVAERMQGQIAAEIRVMLGEAALSKSLFTPDQIQRRIEAMRKCAAESTSDTDRHESWMKMHLDAGWTYAPGEFDPVKKTHPNLLPWDQLPATVKSKARIFDIVAKTFAAIEGDECDNSKAPEAFLGGMDVAALQTLRKES